jgi:hypothetical protein
MSLCQNWFGIVGGCFRSEIDVKVGLLFSEDEVKILRRKVQKGLAKKMWENVLEKAEASLESFTEERMREEIDKSFVSQLGKATQAGLAYLITEDRRFADLAKRICSLLLGLPKLKRSGGKPMDADIELADYAREIAIVYDWIYDTLTTKEKEWMLDTLIKKAVVNPSKDFEFSDEKGARLLLRVVPTFSTKESFDPFHAEGSRNNWDSNMASALGIIGLVAGQPEWVEVAKKAIKLYLEELMDEDGCCKEGYGYYCYGVFCALFFLEALRHVRNEDLYTEGLLKSADWVTSLFSPTWVGILNFHDCGYELSVVDYASLLKLASKGRNGHAQWWGEQLAEKSFKDKKFGTLENVMELIYYDPTVKPVAPRGASYKCYSRNGWIVLRSGWDKDATLFGFRSGPPTGAHTHLDNNSFIFEAYGERLVVDSGVLTYIDPNYTKWDKRTIAHNTILVDGADQKPWRLNMSPDGQIKGHIRESPDEEAILYSGQIPYYREEKEYVHFFGDATECYQGLERFHRHVLYAKSGYLVIVDDLIAPKESQFEWRLHSNNLDGKETTEVKGDMVRFVRPKATLLVKVVKPSSFDYRWNQGRIDGIEKASNYISLCPKEKKKKDIFFTVLFPVKKGHPEPAFHPYMGLGSGIIIQKKDGKDIIEYRPEIGITFRHEEQ